ncbi:MAG: hypothetical protein ABSE95_17155 [Thermodesulfobacteriota bacterium]|jgi:hypothetical protein
MDKKTKELFKMFEIGVENERNAQEFYENLIKKALPKWKNKFSEIS